MNRVPFGQGGCEKTRQYLDSYISNELLVETTHDVLRHLENCSACSAEVEARTRLRDRLRVAVKSQSIPPELRVRIREQIRSSRPHHWLHGWAGWSMAMATSLMLCAAIWWTGVRDKMPALADRPGQAAYIQKVSATLSAVLKVGLGDHIHCSVFRKYPKNPPPVEKMEADLGPAYRDLLPLVHAAVPAGYRVIMAHHCGFAGRKFVHLTLEKDGDLLSLVIARKEPGDSLAGLSPAAEPSGIPIYQGAAQRYQVAGFEAGEFLAFVVSDLKDKANLEVAENLAPAVREFLVKTPA